MISISTVLMKKKITVALIIKGNQECIKTYTHNTFDLMKGVCLQPFLHFYIGVCHSLYAENIVDEKQLSLGLLYQ
jgi:hypothetical protein